MWIPLQRLASGLSVFPGAERKESAKAEAFRIFHPGASLCGLIALCGFLSPLLKSSPASSTRAMIASNGQPAAEIGVGDSANPTDQFVAAELQKYIEALSGAKLEIVSAHEMSGKAKGKSVLLVGGPADNELVRQAVSRRQVNFEGLKTEGYILRRISVE